MNVRDLGGWPTGSGAAGGSTPGRTAYGRLYRSDRLSNLSAADQRHLDERGIVTVIDLRYRAEVAEHPSRLWPSVTHHHQIPMGGDLADQRTFLERAFSGDMGPVSDDDVAQSYLTMLSDHGPELGQAVEALLAATPALFHCSAGKDRTGLLSMLVLGTVGVSDDDILTDFELSNLYRTERRINQLRPLFSEQGLDVEAYRAALGAPRSALEAALAWLRASFGTPARYLSEAAGVVDPTSRLSLLLVE